MTAKASARRATTPAHRSTPAPPGHAPNPQPAPGPDPELIKRLSRIEGQLRGIGGMVRDDRYCIDILTQMAAVHEALRAVSRRIVERHMQTCVATALKTRDPREAARVSREMAQLLDRFTR